MKTKLKTKIVLELESDDLNMIMYWFKKGTAGSKLNKPDQKLLDQFEALRFKLDQLNEAGFTI